MIKLYDKDGYIAEIVMQECRLGIWGDDFSADFFDVGHLEYNEFFDAYKVDDIDLVREQLNDWSAGEGDYQDDVFEDRFHDINIDECPDDRYTLRLTACESNLIHMALHMLSTSGYNQAGEAADLLESLTEREISINPELAQYQEGM